MTRPSHITSIEKSTSISWEEWVTLLEPFRALDHTQTAREVLRILRERQVPGNGEWWAQAVTVAWEQSIGRRMPGQSCAGDYGVAVSKTLTGNPEETLERWLKLAGDKKSFLDVAIVDQAAISRTAKWIYWRCGLADGSRISVNITAKPRGEKSSLSVNHSGIEEVDTGTRWREYWKTFLSDLV